MNKAISRRRLFQLAGVGSGAALLAGCGLLGTVESTLSPTNVSTVVTAVGNIGQVASYITAVVAAVNAAAAFVGVTIPAGVATALTDAENIANTLANNGTVQAVQTAVGNALTDVETVLSGFGSNVSGELQIALADAAQLVPEIASAVGLVVSAATPSAGMRRAGATVPVTMVLADLKRIAALKK